MVLAPFANKAYFAGMALSIDRQTGSTRSFIPSAATALIAVAVVAVLTGTAALWVAYGDRVYFDSIMNGLASCFSF